LIASVTSLFLLTSKHNIVTLTLCESSCCNASNFSLFLPQIIKSILLFANAFAVAKPMPELAPVMSAILVEWLIT
jgi:hypothetical protein